MLKLPADRAEGERRPSWYRSWFAATTAASQASALPDVLILPMCGDDDVRTPVGETRALEARLGELGREVDIRVYPELGHGFSARRDGKPTLGPIEGQVLGTWARGRKGTCRRGKSPCLWSFDTENGRPSSAARCRASSTALCQPPK